ncbi:response regulator [Pedobacter sp. PWIIR3]
MPKRILIIDDDEDILTIFDLIFGEEGYETILYRTGTTIDEIKILHPDLILLDVRISGYAKSGDEICAEIKAATELAEIPVLLVSAEIDVNLRADDCGANGYISKPFDINNLLARVKSYMS